AVHPYGNMLTVVEATGQQILDCLEFGVSAWPAEFGGFQQVAGLTFEIHTYIESSVTTDENGMFTGVDGDYRVQNVMVNGEALDLEKTYTVASHNYMLKQGGDGFTMFQGDNILQDEVMIDNQVLITYIRDILGGTVGEAYSDLFGQGRITFVTEQP
ncbi:MAG TPA: 5'-nucleotidase C-terminal domain-containing protein, partial [Candidatus Aphodomonas merdavium]|nr:5'-nucleotidase C-terminal domain-containing protein [Candidatus Aphodomonas merdavium]